MIVDFQPRDRALSGMIGEIVLTMRRAGFDSPEVQKDGMLTLIMANSAVYDVKVEIVGKQPEVIGGDDDKPAT